MTARGAAKEQHVTSKPMTPAQAAKVWKELEPAVEEHKAIASRFDAAGKVLKKHMAAKGLDVYLGIERHLGSGGQRLDDAKVKVHLGDRLAEFMYDSVRVSLRRRGRTTRPSSGS